MTLASDDLVLRPFTTDELVPLYAFSRIAFHDGSQSDEDREIELSVFEPDRSIGLFDGGTIVGSAGAFTRDMTVPGGPIPVACVTWVSVAAGYTRRGLLTRMMRHQLTELHKGRREPVAALWASESGIYGRYGYGVAARHARLSANLRELQLVSPVPPTQRNVRAGAATDAALRRDISAVYERARRAAGGHLDRRDAWWDFRLADPEEHRHGGTPLRTVVHDGPEGPDGYALFSTRSSWQEDGPAGSVTIRELCAETPEAEAALWSFVFSLDLISELNYRISPADSPLLHLVNHPRRLGLTACDNLWVRVVDVDRALAARTYAAPVDLVLDVTDPFCPWNEGRWRLSGDSKGAVCGRTSDPADLALSVRELASAYLGGFSLGSLARAGRVRELRGGALTEASAAFRSDVTPWLPHGF